MANEEAMRVVNTGTAFELRQGDTVVDSLKATEYNGVLFFPVEAVTAMRVLADEHNKELARKRKSACEAWEVKNKAHAADLPERRKAFLDELDKLMEKHDVCLDVDQDEQVVVCDYYSVLQKEHILEDSENQQ